MVYRVLREDWEAVDPIGANSSAAGFKVYNDGTTTAPWINRPGQSKEQYIVSEALRLMSIPRAQILQMRPPVPQELFPPIYGYDTTPLGIDQVLDTNRWSPQRRSWVSGVIRYPRHSDVESDMINASARNINSSLTPGG